MVLGEAVERAEGGVGHWKGWWGGGRECSICVSDLQFLRKFGRKSAAAWRHCNNIMNQDSCYRSFKIGKCLVPGTCASDNICNFFVMFYHLYFLRFNT